MVVRKTSKKIGRPTLPVSEKKLATMGFRPTPLLRKNLEKHSLENNRSMGKEIESRLENSFEREKAAKQVRSDQAGGKFNEITSVLLGSVLATVDDKIGGSWTSDSASEKEAVLAVVAILKALKTIAPDPKRKIKSDIWDVGPHAAAKVLREYADLLDGVSSPTGMSEEEAVMYISRALQRQEIGN